jgi:plastocyanin
MKLQNVSKISLFAVPFAVLLALCGLGSPSEASAHGPTIEIKHDELKPALLNLFVGTTVHFSNTVAMPGGHVIVDESGLLESPPLEKPGDGWHYTFEKEGTYEIYIRQHPTVKARIVVVPKRTNPGRTTPGR